MRFSQIAVLALASYASAAPLERRRFGQENAVGLGAKISAVSAGCEDAGDGSLGFNGQEIGPLLAAPDPCLKLQLADDLLEKAKANCPPDVVDQIIPIAMELCGAEKNFNPFAGNLDSVCLTPGIPASPELQGILQKVDPRVDAPNNDDPELAALAAALNAKAEQVLADAQAALTGPGSGGKSMAELLADNGFVAIQGFDGVAGAPPPPPPEVVEEPVVEEPVVEEPVVEDVPAEVDIVNNGGGNCNAGQLEVIEQGKEQRFGLDGQQVALNPGIVIERICNALQDADCKARCEIAKEAVAATGVKGSSQGDADLNALQQLADEFNSALV